MTQNNHPLYFLQDKPWLAPLAGYSDLSFRLLCREQGAAVACTEMVSAKGLVYGLERRKKTSGGTEALLVTIPDDSPLVVQLFGAEKYFLEKSVEVLLERGYEWFDLNMGCSVPKVNKTGSGSAMMKDVANALEVAKAMIDAAPAGHVGFKIRLGWSAPDAIYLDFAKALEQLGAGWITLHPRYARQGFSGKADWTALTALVNALSIPVIASGDLLTAKDAIRCVEETGVATVMFARGAINNPAIFRQYYTMMAQRAQMNNSIYKSASISSGSTSILGDSASISSDSASILGDSASISGNSASISSDSASILGDSASISGNSASISSDSASISGDSASILGDSASILGDSASISSESASISSESASISSDSASISGKSASILGNSASISSDSASILGFESSSSTVSNERVSCNSLPSSHDISQLHVEDLTHAEVLSLILRHAELAKQWVKGKTDKRGLEPALVVMRTTTPRYVKHLPGIRYLRHDLSLCKTWEEFNAVVHTFFSVESNKEL